MRANPLSAVYWMIINCFSMTMIFALGKLLSEEIHIIQVVFIYHLIALFFILLIMGFAGFDKVKTAKKHILFLRACMHLGGFLAFFHGLRFVSLDSATAVTYLLPIFTSYLGAIFYKEKFNKAKFIALLAGLFGMLIMLRPGTEDFQVPLIWVVISVVVWAMTSVLTKNLGQTEHVITHAFYTLLFGTALCAPLAFYYWIDEIRMDELFLLTVLAALHLIQIVSIFSSFKLGDISSIMPLDYIRLPISAIIGYLMFDEIMTKSTFLGCTIIILGGIYLIHHERKNKGYVSYIQ